MAATLLDGRSLTFPPRFVLLTLTLILLIASGCAYPAYPETDSGITDRATAESASVLSADGLVDVAGQGYSTPVRIVVEAIGLDSPVEELGWSASIGPSGRIFNNWDVTAYAAGWHVNSNVPGQGGNVVMSGHNNILGAVFRDLDRLEAGDVINIWAGETRFDYEITEVVIVPERDASPEQRRKNAEWIGDFDDDRLTLITCWPRHDNSHRVIAVAHRVDVEAVAAALE